jgi:hypothetical protein
MITASSSGGTGCAAAADSGGGANQRPRSRGEFKYAVVSEENPGLRLDPIIVVEEPPTEP